MRAKDNSNESRKKTADTYLEFYNCYLNVKKIN